MVVGGENVLITNPRDIPGFVKELAKHKYTMITGVNTLFNALLNHPDFAKLDFSSAAPHARRRHGGAEGGRRALAAGHRHHADRGLRPHRDLAFGDGESADLGEYSGSIGVPMPSTEVVLRDDDDQRRGASASPARSASAARR